MTQYEDRFKFLIYDTQNIVRGQVMNVSVQPMVVQHPAESENSGQCSRKRELRSVQPKARELRSVQPKARTQVSAAES